jgi:autotransporter-associated beta strand protein
MTKGFSPWGNYWRILLNVRKRRSAAARHRRILLETLEDRSLLAQLVNEGTAADVVFTLPAAANIVIMEDDGTSGNGISQLRSSNGTFDTTTFANPTGSLTINRGNAADTIAVSSLPDFTAGLTIGSRVKPLNVVSLAGAITLGSGKNLSASAATVNATAAGAILLSGGGVISWAADNVDINAAASVSAAAGGAIVVSPLSAGRAINLGSETVGLLCLTDAELDRMTTGTLQIGDANSGPILVSAPVDRIAGSTTAIILTTGGNNSITYSSSGSLDAKNGNVSLLINPGGTGAISSASAATAISGANLSLTAGSGGIGTSAIPFHFTAMNFNSTTGGNGNQFLASDSGPTTIDAIGLSAGAGAIELDGSNTFTLGGNNRIDDNSKLKVNGAIFAIGTNSDTVGGITLSSGSITGSTGVLTSTTNIQTESGSISAVLSGTNGLTQSTPGATTLSGANIYGGQTSVTDGTLTLANSTATGTSSIVVTSTTGGVGLTGTRIAVQGGINVSNPLSLSANNIGDIRSNLFATSGDNIWSGPITLNGTGVIAFGGNSGANLNITGGVSGPTFTGTFIGARSTTNNFVSTFSSTIDLPTALLGLAVANFGTLVLNSTGNSFPNVMISAGTLRLGVDNALPTGVDMALGNGSNTGVFDLAGFNQQISRVAVSSGATASIQKIGNSSASSDSTLTISGGASSFAGVIGDALGIGTRKTALNVLSGTFTLAGASTYTGATTVSGGSLLVTGSITSNVTVTSGAALGGTGTINAANTVTVTGGGHLAPGPGPAIFNSGNISLANGSNFDVELNGNPVGKQYDQQNVTGTVSLGSSTLHVTLGFTPAVGDAFTILNNDTNDAVIGTFNGLPEGGVVSVTTGLFSGAFQISYLGGDGNDVVLTTLNVASPALQGTSANDAWLVQRSGSDAQITLNGSIVWSTPFAPMLGLTIDGLAGNDTLTVDLSSGDVVPNTDGIRFQGGSPALGPGDSLVITGGNQGTVIYNYTNAHDGSIVLSNFGTISYTGLEPITNSGTATDIIFSLPTASSTAFLEDDGTSGNGISQLRSSNGTFETTAFANPSGSLKINRGNAADTLTINALPDFSATLTIASTSNPLASLTLAGAATLAAGKSLLAAATATNVAAAGAIAVSSGGAIGLFADDLSINGGATINAATGTISIDRLTSNRDINLGSEASGKLSLTDTELDRFAAGTLTIGNTIGGQITISAPINVANNTTPIPVLHLLSHGGVIDGNATGTDVTVASLAIEGFGSPAAVSSFITQVTTLAAAYTGAGDIQINNIGSLTVTTVDGLVGVNDTGGGVFLTAGGTLTVSDTVISPSGPIQLAAAGNDQLLTVDALIQTTGNGTFTADKIAILHTVNFGFGTLKLVPESVVDSGDAIVLGSSTDSTANTLELSSAEINTLFVGTVQIGDAASGPITISSNVAAGFGTHVTLTSGQGINFTGGTLSTSGGGNLTLAPGSAAAVGVAKSATDVDLSTSGTLSFASGSDLAVAVNGATVDTEYQQLNVVGKVILTGVDLALSGTFAPTSGQAFTIVKNDASDAVSGTFNGLPEGKVFSVPGGTLSGLFQITYQGGDGNDVVLTAVNAANPALFGTGGDDAWLVRRSGSNVNISLNGTVVLSPSFASLSSLTLNGLAGNDTLTVNLSSGDVIPAGGLSFNGGNPTTLPGDKLTIVGGNQGTVTYNYTSGHDGSIVMSNFGAVNYTGIEPITNSGTATDIIFNLPVTSSTAFLEDDGTISNSLSQLRSGNGTFETTIFSTPDFFSTPTGSVQINAGSATDTLIVGDLPDFNSGLMIGTTANPLDTVTFAGVVAFGASEGLSANANAILVTSPLSTSGGNITFSSTNGITIQAGLATHGGNVSIDADIDADGVGSLTLADAVQSTFVQRTKLDSANGATFGDFGNSVAVSGDGSTAIVGAPGEYAATVFIVTPGGWIQQQRLTRTNGTGGEFGWSVALSSDGNTAIVGAINVDIGMNTDQGVATVFTRVNGVWTEQQELTATGGAKLDRFGYSVALSSDGDTAIIGAADDDVGTTLNQGTATVFVRTAGIWTQQQQLTATGAASFGISVALSSDGNTAIVGANASTVGTQTHQGTATVFTRLAGVWTQQQQLAAVDGEADDFFGTSVALSSDGNTAIVGAFWDDVGTTANQGSATVFTRSNGFWTQQQQLLAAAGAEDDEFGFSVALSSDGNSALVGAFFDDFLYEDQGTAVQFKRSAGIWTQQQQFTTLGGASFGLSVALSGDGITAIVGSPRESTLSNTKQGAAYAFSAGALVAADAGLVTVRAGDVDIRGPIFSTEKVSLLPSQINRSINLGSNSAGAFSLTDGELDEVSAETIQIGDSNSGSITISNVITRPAATVVNLASSGAINFAGGGLNTNGGSVTLMPGSTASVGVANSLTDVTVGVSGVLAFAGGSHLAIPINGPVSGTNYDQLTIAGQVDLTGVDLSLSGNYTPMIGDQFTIVDNDVSDAVIGEFNGLPEGKVFNSVAGALNADFQITYHGGDGNDVVLTATNLAPTLDVIWDPAVILEDAGPQTIDLTGIFAGGTQSQFLTVVATSSDLGLLLDPQVTYTSPNATALLSYQPLHGQNGIASITVTVKDNGGTESGSDTFSRSFSVRIAEVNNSPTGVNNSLSSVAEDSGTRTIAFATLLANDVKGPANESGQTLTITGVSAPVGGTVSIVGTDVIFTPTHDYNGAASFTYALQDDGTTSGAPDFKTSTAVVSFNIDEVNDPPSFVSLGNQAVNDDDGLQSIPGWASAISAGPPNEAGQKLAFTIAGNTNPAIFSGPITIGADGTLSFTPLSNTEGTAVLTVRLEDDAGIADGGVNFVTQQFQVEVKKPHRWHNGLPPYAPINRGGMEVLIEDEAHSITPTDVLLIINYLNAGLPTKINSATPIANGTTLPFYDVDADDSVTSTDALLIINLLNAGQGGPIGGEGEGGNIGQSAPTDVCFQELGSRKSGQYSVPIASNMRDLASLIAALAADETGPSTPQRRRR